MEYIESSTLAQLADKLNHLSLGTHYISVRLDAFVSTYKRRSSKHKKSDIKIEEGALPATESPYFKSGLLSLPSALTDTSPQNQEGSVADAHDILSGYKLNSADSMPDYKRARSNSWGLQPSNDVGRVQRRRTSSLGDLSEPSSQALFMDMITALNEAFPDYDFEDSKIQQFKDISVSDATRLVNSQLVELTLQDSMILQDLWSSIDEVMTLRQCEVFSFTPDDDNDGEFLWRLNLFFFNKISRKLCYFACEARSMLRRMSSGAYSDEEEEEAEAPDSFDERGITRTGSDSEDERIGQERDDPEDDDSDDVPDW
ncbi:hypothetical protein EON65_01130 [archaeon]|nr:MAG: hypothetical protein EON65_01130 [archaeon]